MRVNVDSSTEKGPKFVLLGRALSVSWHDARSRCVSVWLVCYNQRSEFISAIEVDIAADLDGFAAAMCSVGLAQPTKRDAKLLRIDGVKERIAFLKKQSEKGKRGGEASGKARGPQGERREARPEADAQANASRPAQARHEAYSPDLDLALSPAPSPDQAQEKVHIPAPGPPSGRRSTRGPGSALVKQATAAVVDAFNRTFQRKLSPDGWEKGVEAVLAKGYTEAQMRGVVWWAAQEWADDPDMRARLTPTTLLKFSSSQGYRTFPQYLSCAGERWRETHDGEPPPWDAAVEPEPVHLALVGAEA